MDSRGWDSDLRSRESRAALRPGSVTRSLERPKPATARRKLSSSGWPGCAPAQPRQKCEKGSERYENCYTAGKSRVASALHSRRLARTTSAASLPSPSNRRTSPRAFKTQAVKASTPQSSADTSATPQCITNRLRAALDRGHAHIACHSESSTTRPRRIRHERQARFRCGCVKPGCRARRA